MAISNMLFVSKQTPQGPSQMDLYSRLLDEQIIFLNGEINVATICVGQADSMAAILLASGTKGKRMAFPNARVMIHQPLGGAQGQASDIQIQAKEMNRAKNLLDDILVYHTGQPIEVIEKDTDRDFFLTAEKALEYGLIDKIIKAGEGVVKVK